MACHRHVPLSRGILAVAVGLQSEQAPSRYMGDLVEYYLDQAPNKQVANDVAGVSRALVFGWPGVATALSSEANPAAPSLLGGALQRSTRGQGRELILVTMHAVELLGVRLMLLFSALPALALLLAVALIDGLVARYVRRECGGHESANASYARQASAQSRHRSNGGCRMANRARANVSGHVLLSRSCRRSGSRVGHGQVLQEIFVRQKMHASWRSG